MLIFEISIINLIEVFEPYIRIWNLIPITRCFWMRWVKKKSIGLFKIKHLKYDSEFKFWMWSFIFIEVILKNVLLFIFYYCEVLYFRRDVLHFNFSKFLIRKRSDSLFCLATFTQILLLVISFQELMNYLQSCIY